MNGGPVMRHLASATAGSRHDRFTHHRPGAGKARALRSGDGRVCHRHHGVRGDVAGAVFLARAWYRCCDGEPCDLCLCARGCRGRAGAGGTGRADAEEAPAPHSHGGFRAGQRGGGAVAQLSGDAAVPLHGRPAAWGLFRRSKPDGSLPRSAEPADMGRVHADDRPYHRHRAGRPDGQCDGPDDRLALGLRCGGGAGAPDLRADPAARPIRQPIRGRTRSGSCRRSATGRSG